MIDRDDDDLLAAEYVLGTLDTDARRVAELRRGSDGDFDRAVTGWERRLVPLSELGREVEPPAHLWTTIRARVAALTADALPGGSTQRSTIIRLNRQVSRWKRATAAALILAACLAVWVGVSGSDRFDRSRTFVAVLQKTDEAPAFLMRADLDDRTLAVHPIAASTPAGKSYELWMIEPSVGAPKSLGLIDTPVSRAALPDFPPEVLSRATYAVTLESSGGSPTGMPTTAPIFFGHLLRTTP